MWWAKHLVGVQEVKQLFYFIFKQSVGGGHVVGLATSNYNQFCVL